MSGAVICPAGFYCPEAVAEPLPCGILDICNEGSQSRLQLLGLVILSVVLTSVVIVFFVIKMRERVHNRRVHTLSQSSLLNTDNGNSCAVMNVDIKFTGLQVNVTTGEKKLLGRVIRKGSSKTIMNNVTGRFRPGRISAIMGPSGAGKSTLVSILLGHISHSKGSILINGKPGQLKRLRSIIGFVPQSDIMLTMLTVEEILMHSARSRLPRDISYENVVERVNMVIQQLNLTNVRYSIIGNEVVRGISGGQRKRVNVGMELVADPAVLFLDEPTTGLDASTSLELIHCLRIVADEGRTIVAVVHQPRFEMFNAIDDVLFLGKGGHVVYEGTTVNAKGYFSSLGFECPNGQNPADYFLDIISGKVACSLMNNEIESSCDNVALSKLRHDPKKLFDSWQEHLSNHDKANNVVDQPKVDAPLKPKKANILKQVYFCAVCALKQYYHQPKNFIVFVALHVLLGGSLGGGFTQALPWYTPCVPDWIARHCPPYISNYCENIPTFHQPLQDFSFFAAFAAGSAALSQATITFGLERAIYIREASNGGSYIFSYFLGKNLVDIPLIILGSLVFTSVFIAIVEPLQSFGDLYLTFFMIEWVGWGFGYFTSLIMAPKNSIVVGIVAIFAMCVCSGISPRLKRVYEDFGVLRIAWDLSFPRYAAEALYIKEVEVYANPAASSLTMETLRSLSYLGYDIDNFTFDIGIMFVLGLCFRIISFLSIIYQLRKRLRSS